MSILTLTERVMEFFEANPDEELTRSDVAAKFDARPGAAETVLTLLTQSGYLREGRESGGYASHGRRVWRKAP